MEVSLVSGGIDSTLGYKLFTPNATPVFIDYGHKYAKSERRTLYDTFKDSLLVIDVKSGHQCSDIFVPNRNLTLVSLCVTMLPSVSKINIFGLKDDNCIDKNMAAYKKMTNIVSGFCNSDIIVLSPTQHLSKVELVKLYITKFGAKLPKTFSCYLDGDNECMDCPACLRKHIALFENNIPSNNVLKNGIVSQYIARTDISKKRIAQIIKYRTKCLTSNH